MDKLKIFIRSTKTLFVTDDEAVEFSYSDYKTGMKTVAEFMGQYIDSKGINLGIQFIKDYLGDIELILPVALDAVYDFNTSEFYFSEFIKDIPQDIINETITKINNDFDNLNISLSEGGWITLINKVENINLVLLAIYIEIYYRIYGTVVGTDP